MSEPEVLSLDSVATELGFTPEQVAAVIHSAELPAVKPVGGKASTFKISRAALDAYLDPSALIGEVTVGAILGMSPGDAGRLLRRRILPSVSGSDGRLRTPRHLVTAYRDRA